MSDPIDSKPATGPRYEIRPSPFRQWNAEAPDEYVNLDAKPLGFGDVLQALNPLQHLPVIGSIYRAVTGATIEPAARVIGGVLFGGIVGGISAVANAVIEGVSGKDLGEHVFAMVAPGKDAPPAPPAPPSGDGPLSPERSGELHFAAYRAGGPPTGTLERNGLLTTWIANGAPREADQPQPFFQPAHRPEILAAELPAPVPAAAPMPLQAAAPAPVAATAGEMRAMPLDTYRARAQPVQGAAARAPAINDTQGLGRRAEAARALASYRSQASTNMLPAALQAQQAYDGAESPQSFFSASVALGLERYRQLQQQRDGLRKGI